MAADPDRALALRVRRGQLIAKLDEWDAAHPDATDVDRNRSRERRELQRLLGDVDSFVASFEAGTAGAAAAIPPTKANVDAERRAERGRIKALMRRWDHEFERMHSRKPTQADRDASEELALLKQQLRTEVAAGKGPSSSTAATCATAGSASEEALLRSGGGDAEGSADQRGASTGASDVGLAEDYHELLRARVQSQLAVNGFEGLSAADVHAASASFAAWDIGRNGALSFDDFQMVVASLSETTLDADTAKRLFALADADSNGLIDLNEFLAIYKLM